MKKKTEHSELLAFTVLGQPVPKQSFRKTRNGGYTDPRVKAWQEAVGWKAREVMQGQAMTSGVELAVELEFHLKDRRVVDLDNLSKGTIDGLKGIVFSDDSDIYRLTLSKVTGSQTPHVWICVQSLCNITES